ncbi:cyclic nucleotide-binding domain-containing protein [Anthocerotibacter panamensis]|uniref:cyclic nucleotide-binding domain-containing protein n=1 Tax=Anthocerotibacter panamensis TaxID=2857077 RepID=UPI001C402935|nr:cyclic nucleotide-binding domain-containing protein [Anthocerotibacter panamensis]
MNFDRFKPQTQVYRYLAFLVLLVGLLGLALEPIIGPYGKFFNLVNPEYPQEYMPMGTLVVWTVVLIVPAFVLFAGYYTWRTLCPLAFFAQLPRVFGIQRKSSLKGTWLEQNYMYVQFGFLSASLMARLLFINPDSYLLEFAAFLLFGSAFITGYFFTGKTWCNYICPMGPVEKAFSEPRPLLMGVTTLLAVKDPSTSMCLNCTGCKISCPDIDLERGYWDEISNRARRIFYYGYPGLVAGYYGWYYLHRGTFEYYFSAEWTREKDILGKLFEPGFFFWTVVPKYVAVPLTVIFFILLSLVIFSVLEQIYRLYLDKKQIILDEADLMNGIYRVCNFVAFITFYSFAGAPVLRYIPWLQGVVSFVILLGASIWLFKGLNRTVEDWRQESLGRKFLSQWSKVFPSQPPKDLREVYLRYSMGKEFKDKRLEIFKQTVIEALADGTVTSEKSSVLASLRTQCDVTEGEQKKVFQELKIVDPEIFNLDHTRELETRIQLESYRNALQGMIAENIGRKVVDSKLLRDGTLPMLKPLRDKYGVTQVLHERVYRELFEGSSVLNEKADRCLKEIANLNSYLMLLTPLLNDIPNPGKLYCALLIQALKQSRNLQVGCIRELIAEMQSLASAEAATKLTDDLRLSLQRPKQEREKPSTRELFESLNPLMANPISLVRAYTAWLLYTLDTGTGRVFARNLTNDPSQFVRDLVQPILSVGPSIENYGSLAWRMAGLSRSSLFGSIDILAETSALEEMARVSYAIELRCNDVVFEQEEESQDVYLLVEGEAVATVRRGDTIISIGTISSGECAGELTALNDGKRSATVTICSPMAAIVVIPGAVYARLIRSEPGVSASLLTLLSQRLRNSLSALSCPLPQTVPVSGSTGG